MRVGVNAVHFGPWATPAAMERTAQVVEGLGYHLLMISDHVTVTEDVAAQYPAPFYEPFSTLGWLAGITRRVELGVTVVILPYRHPLQVARAVAGIDQLSGGRFVLGVGVGWAHQEFEALGVPRNRRGAISDDYLAAIRTLWTQDVASHEGPFVSFKNVHAGPPPARVPHPPVWVGGSSEAAMRRAVRLGEAWHPINEPVGRLRALLPRLREIAEAEGRPVPEFAPRTTLHLTEEPLPETDRLPGEGTADQLRASLGELQEMGATAVVLDTYRGAQHPEPPEVIFRRLATVAEEVADLEHETVR